MVVGDIPETLGPRAVDRLSDFTQRQPKAAHGGFRKQDQLSPSFGGPCGIVGDQLQIHRGVTTSDDLSQRYPKSASRRLRPWGGDHDAIAQTRTSALLRPVIFSGARPDSRSESPVSIGPTPSTSASPPVR